MIQTVKWSHGGSNVYRISSAADLQLVSSDCKCGRNAKAASSSSAAAANGTSLASIGGGSTEWMPSTEDVLVVCSVFHACSDRGIVVCRLHDTSRLWLVTSSELQRVRAVPYEHIYKKGDFVKLDSTCTGVSAAKCLGAPSEDRWGVVIGAGASRRGIQRNIEVVLFVELADNGEGFEPVVSLYSSLDLLLVPRCVQRLEEDEKQSLIDTLKQLSESTKIAFNVPVLVNKLGLDVFSKLWPLFADANAYSAAYLAFCKWQKSRASPSQLLPEPIRKLLEQRNFHEQTCEELNAGAFQFAKDWFAALDVKEVTGGKWQCKDCGIDNRALSMKCEVCGSMAPSWKCVWCMQNNADAYSSCKHCNHPKDGDSCVANVPSGSGGAPHRIETNPDRRPMPFQFLDGFSAKPPAAAIANCSIGIPYGCRVRVQSDCVNNGKVGRVLCVTTLPLDEMTVSSKADNTTEVARAVTITGVEGANDKLLNGTYLLVEGARCEGKPFYMKEDSFLHEGSVRIEYNSTKVCWQVKSQKQGEAIKCTERAVDESIPETWTADVHYQIKDSDCFEKDEICVIKRSDGEISFLFLF